MIKEAFEYLVDVGQSAQEDKEEPSRVTEVRPNVYADAEGRLAVALNAEIARRERKVDDVVRAETALDVQSFIALVNAHKSENAQVFVGQFEAVAVMDMSGWRRHLVRLPLKPSRSWQTWSKPIARHASNVADEIAPYIDDVQSDPIGGDALLTCLSGLDWISEDSTRVKHTATGMKIEQKSGERVAELPRRFRVAPRVYEFEDRAYVMFVRLSAKRVNGERSIVFTPVGAEQLERDARGYLLKEIRAGLEGVPVFAGVPALDLDEKR